MKATRRLGRGLDALLDLAPAATDGTARVAEAIANAPGDSVLATSLPPRAAPPAPAPTPRAPVEPGPSAARFELFDPPLDATAFEVVVDERDAGVARPPPPAPSPPPPPTPRTPPQPEDGRAFVDDEVFGIDFPDVDLGT